MLDSLPPEMRRFLLRTCIARVLTTDLAHELSGDPDSDARLTQLERSGVFVTQGSDATRSYQVHALFGELLRARLRHDEPELARSLLSRAARWFVEHDMPVEAERHAYEAADLKLAGALSCRRFVREALTGTWIEPGEAPISLSEAATIPELALIAAANATAVLDRRSALMWRSRLDVLCASDPRGDDPADDGWFAAARLLLDVFYGRALGTDARSVSSCRALLETEIGADTPVLHAVARLREAELLLDSADEEAPLRALLDAASACGPQRRAVGRRRERHASGPDCVDSRSPRFVRHAPAGHSAAGRPRPCRRHPPSRPRALRRAAWTCQHGA